MKNKSSIFSFLFSILFYFAINFYSYGQISSTNSGNCVLVRIDYCTNWLTTYYGSERIVEVKLERDKKIPLKDQVNKINNILADTLNKLEQEGYKITSSTSDNLEGSTCGITFVLYK